MHLIPWFSAEEAGSLQFLYAATEPETARCKLSFSETSASSFISKMLLTPHVLEGTVQMQREAESYL